MGKYLLFTDYSGIKDIRTNLFRFLAIFLNKIRHGVQFLKNKLVIIFDWCIINFIEIWTLCIILGGRYVKRVESYFKKADFYHCDVRSLYDSSLV